MANQRNLSGSRIVPPGRRRRLSLLGLSRVPPLTSPNKGLNCTTGREGNGVTGGTLWGGGRPPRDSRFGSPLQLPKVHWVRPEVVVEVTYLTWTEDNLLRQVSYQGQR